MRRCYRALTGRDRQCEPRCEWHSQACSPDMRARQAPRARLTCLCACNLRGRPELPPAKQRPPAKAYQRPRPFLPRSIQGQRRCAMACKRRWRRQQYLGLCRSALWPQVRAALRAAARDAARAAAAAPAGRSGRSGAPALLRSCLAAHGGALLRLARAAAANAELGTQLEQARRHRARKPARQQAPGAVMRCGPVAWSCSPHARVCGVVAVRGGAKRRKWRRHWPPHASPARGLHM